MASALYFAFSPLLPLPRISTCAHGRSSLTRLRSAGKIRAAGQDLLGDFGARDPFPAEIESNFGEKVLGNVSTEHKILIPNASALSLAQQDCRPVSQLEQSMSEDEARKLLFKVVGWKLVTEEGILKLQGAWKVKDLQSGEELIKRIKEGVESTGHVPVFHLEPSQVRAELWTCSVGGLSVNDFIVAAKIDLIKVSDLQPRLRVWAHICRVDRESFPSVVCQSVRDRPLELEHRPKLLNHGKSAPRVKYLDWEASKAAQRSDVMCYGQWAGGCAAHIIDSSSRQ